MPWSHLCTTTLCPCLLLKPHALELTTSWTILPWKSQFRSSIGQPKQPSRASLVYCPKSLVPAQIVTPGSSHAPSHFSLWPASFGSLLLSTQLSHWLEGWSRLRQYIFNFYLAPLSPQDFSLGAQSCHSGGGHPLWSIPISRCHLCTSSFLLAITFQTQYPQTKSSWHSMHI